MIADDRFHRQVGEKRIPAAENEGLPKAAEAAVAIGEWMDELEFVMEHATGNERVGIGALEPTQQVFHETGHTVGRGRKVNDPVPLGDADGTGTEFSGILREAMEQQVVGGEQILHR